MTSRNGAPNVGEFLAGPVTQADMAHGAALVVIAQVDSRPESERPQVYETYVSRLKHVYPGCFEAVPDQYDPASFAEVRFMAFGNVPLSAVEKFLLAGLQLNQERPDDGLQEERVH